MIPNLILNSFYFNPCNNILGALGRSKKWFNVTLPGSRQLPSCANVTLNDAALRGGVLFGPQGLLLRNRTRIFLAFVRTDFDYCSRQPTELNISLNWGGYIHVVYFKADLSKYERCPSCGIIAYLLDFYVVLFHNNDVTYTHL